MASRGMEGARRLSGSSVSEREYFRGYALQGVDDKGRVAIPAALRAALEANTPPRPDGKDGRQVVISIHEEGACIVAFDVGFANAQIDELKQREREMVAGTGTREWKLLRSGIGPSETLPFDASGRFIMPGFPRDEAGIGDYAFFIGVGDTFEIWDPRRLDKHPTASDSTKSACRYLCKQKGITL